MSAHVRIIDAYVMEVHNKSSTKFELGFIKYTTYIFGKKK
jgi:hypothetical protein